MGQKTADHSGKDVAGAAVGQNRVAGGLNHEPALGISDDGLCPFDPDDGLGPLGQFQGGSQPVGLDVLSKPSREAGHFTRMGRHDDRGVGIGDAFQIMSHGIEAVGIQNQGERTAAD